MTVILVSDMADPFASVVVGPPPDDAACGTPRNDMDPACELHDGVSRTFRGRTQPLTTAITHTTVASNPPASSTPTESATPLMACTVDAHATLWLRRFVSSAR